MESGADRRNEWREACVSGREAAQRRKKDRPGKRGARETRPVRKENR